ncbi:MAG: cell division protein FtsL [Myxococcaceae bacterium]|nr:cell division protein FtsL [Myxococcaceae bacterium]
MSAALLDARKSGFSLSVILLELLPAAILCGLFVTVGIVHVTSRVLVVRVGYDLSRLDNENRLLVREQEQLKLEVATLKAPGRLEKLAQEKLGLVAPAPNALWPVPTR